MLSATGHAGGPRVKTAQVWTPAEVRGARSGGFKVAKTTGYDSAEPEPAKTLQTPRYDILICFALPPYYTVLPALNICTLRQPR